MSERIPATDKGTADRIEADDGGYWVRLVTKQALKREGACMGNCLDSQDYGEHLAGNEDMVSDGFWSLRKADGLSYLLVELNDLCATDMRSARIENALGPKNSQPSGWSIRQLRHLVAAFRAAGATLRIPENNALTGEDGRTWRPDKAPQSVKNAIEAARKAEADKRRAEAQRVYEIPYGQVMFRRAGSDEPFRELGNIASEDDRAQWFIRNDPYARLAAASMAREVVGDGPINPPDGADDLSGTLAVRPGPDQPFQLLRGAERLAAIERGIERGVIARYALVDGLETVTVPARNDPARYTTRNQDGTWMLRLGDFVFPRVMPTGDVGVGDTVTFRLAPQRQARPVRVMRSLYGGYVRFRWLWDEATPTRDRADIEVDINRIEEALIGGNAPAALEPARIGFEGDTPATIEEIGGYTQPLADREMRLIERVLLAGRAAAVVKKLEDAWNDQACPGLSNDIAEAIEFLQGAERRA